MVTVITLVGSEQAEIGRRFVYLGAQMECRTCKLKGICLNLDKGSEYVVKSLRPPVHDCDLSEDKVRVVEVEKVSREIVLEKKYAMDGMTVSFKPSGCGQIGCPHYFKCNPAGLDADDKVTIDKVVSKVECPVDESRFIVRTR